MNYTQATEMLQGRCKDSRKLANNTYLIRAGEDFAVRLHSTNVITFQPNGDIILDSGGWRTVTTKARMNEFSPRDSQRFYVCSDRGAWQVSMKDKLYRFEDGFTIHADGSTSGEVYTSDKTLLKLKRKVSQYVSGFMAAMEAREVPAPSTGDCLYCALRTSKVEKVQLGEYTAKCASGISGNGKQTLGEAFQDTSHLDSHIEERYYVPSLLSRAIETFPHSQVMLWWIGSYWASDTEIQQAHVCQTDEIEGKREMLRRAAGSFARDQVAKVLRRYILRQYGLQA